MEQAHQFFKKSVKLGAGNQLKSSELKKFRQKHNIPDEVIGSSLRVQKVLGVGTKASVYFRCDDNEPVLFSVNEQTPFPTVYAVWTCPDRWPRLEVSSMTMESVERGASVFRPGVVALEGSFKKNDPVALCEDGACKFIGVAVVDSEDIDAMEEGVIAKPLHGYGDALWKEGSLRDPIQPVAAAEEISKEKNDNSNNDGPVDVAVMDERVIRAFSISLLRLKKDQLPILCSALSALAMKEALPGQVIVMRSSSWGKVGLLMDHLVEQNAIRVAQRSPGVMEVTEVLRGSPLYRPFKADLEKEKKEEAAAAAAEEDDRMAAEVVYVFPKRVLNSLEGSLDMELEYVSKKGARDVLMDVLAKEGLEIKSGKVKLNDRMKLALDGGGKKKGAKNEMNHEEDAEINMRDLNEQWLDCLTQAVKIFVGNVMQIKKGTMKPVSIREEKRANKSVTVVQGLALYELPVEDISKTFSSKFACSASIQQDDTVVVQGKHAKDIAKILLDSFRLGPDFVNVAVLDTKKKKK